MKYDRPVWQIMHACADAMPSTFRYEDVRNWFDVHYPDVNEATIRAHLIGLTEGGRAKHVQFAQRSPIFRRVARGEYEPIPLADRGEGPDQPAPSASKIKMSGNGAHHETVESEEMSEAVVDPPAPPASPASPAPPDADEEADDADEAIPDVILLGSVGDRVNVPAPAKEIFREVSFQLSRLDAELSGAQWFVMSAEHGLIAPNEWMSPDSRTLADMEPDYRVAWASWVVARLGSLVGSLDGLLVRVDAPDAFIGPLFADLQDAGAVVTSGSMGVTVPRRAAPYVEAAASAQQLAEALAAERLMIHEAAEPEPMAAVVSIDAGSPVSHHLADLRHAVPATQCSTLPDSPGLYGWVVDPTGARELNRCLMLPVRAGLVFVGQVGGSSWHSLADPVLNLRDHVGRIQLHGRARASTFRMTLATILREHLGMSALEDPKLTEWMLEHLSVTAWSSDDLAQLRDLAQLVITELDPPLNVDHLPATEYRARLSQMRTRLA